MILCLHILKPLRFGVLCYLVLLISASASVAQDHFTPIAPPTIQITDAAIERATCNFWIGAISKKTHEELEADALVIEHAGIQRNDKYLRARGLCRRAYIDLVHGKWNQPIAEKFVTARELTGGKQHLADNVIKSRKHSIARAEVLMLHGYCKAMWIVKNGKAGKRDLNRALALAWATSDDQLLAMAYQYAFVIENFEFGNLLCFEHALMSIHYAEKTGAPVLMDRANCLLMNAYYNNGLTTTVGFKTLLTETLESFDSNTQSFELAQEFRKRAGNKNRKYWKEFGSTVFDELDSEIPKTEVSSFVGAILQYLSFAEFEDTSVDPEKMLALSEFCLSQATDLQDDRMISVSESRRATWLLETRNFSELTSFGEGAFNRNFHNDKFLTAESIANTMISLGYLTNDAVLKYHWRRQYDKLVNKRDLNPVNAVQLSSRFKIGLDEVFRRTRERELASTREAQRLKQNEIATSLEMERRQHEADMVRNRLSLWMLATLSSMLLGATGVLWIRSRSMKRINFEQQREMKRRENFLAMLSHELRNPMAAVVNAVELEQQLVSNPERANQKPGLPNGSSHDIILRQTDHMARLLECLLDVNRFGLGKFDIRKEKLDLVPLTNDVLLSVRHKAAEKNQTISVAHRTEVIWVEADPTRMLQAQVNLLTNAVKFTPDNGNIWLELGIENSEAVIEVRDSGDGVPKELQEQIFDLFTQGNVTIDRSNGGMGVGLSLAREIVELHGGQLTLKSKGIGHGSTFRITIPLVASSNAQSTSPTKKPTASVPRDHVLLVEDIEDTRVVLAQILKVRGFKVVECGNGLEALEYYKTNFPLVVISDIGMPVMDGYELAHRIRKLDPANNTLLIAVTGYNSESDRAKTQDAGFDHHLPKPVSFKVLEDLVRSKLTQPHTE